MKINVAGLVKGPTGTTKVVELQEPIDLEDQDLEVVAPLSGRLRLVRDPAGILVEGALETRVAMPCGRCLQPAEATVRFELTEHFRPIVTIPSGAPILPDPEEEDEPATRLDEKHVLDLTSVARQTLLLNLPLKPRCRPDCRGLCPTCGADRNVDDCQCEPEPDPRWDALRTLIEES